MDGRYSSDHFFAQNADIDATSGERPGIANGVNFEAMTMQTAMAKAAMETGCAAD